MLFNNIKIKRDGRSPTERQYGLQKTLHKQKFHYNYNTPYHSHVHSAKYQQDSCNIYISKGVGVIAITRFLLPNTGRVDNSKTAASRAVVLICSTLSQPYVQSYHRSIIRISDYGDLEVMATDGRTQG